jgi:spermidine synthase
MAAPGQIARKVLGHHFEPVGNLYRRFFVDLDKIVAFLDENIPENARVLDIGGGDGAVIDRLLNRRPDLAITVCDLAASIGGFLSEQNRAKVRLLPATDFMDVGGDFDVVTISDVVHHVPVSEREAFFRSLAEACAGWKCRKVILKDIEPKGVRAQLSLLADRYVTGDRHVVLFSRADFEKMAVPNFRDARRMSALPDAPNYCEVLSW